MDRDALAELIVSQVVPGAPMAASVDEFVTLAEFPVGAPTNGHGRPVGLKLGIEKFRLGRNTKHYRLIWIGRGKTALAAEDTAEHATKTKAIAAGVELATASGVELDERTR